MGNIRIAKEKTVGGVMFVMTTLSLLLVVAMAVGLYFKSAPIFEDHSLWE